MFTAADVRQVAPYYCCHRYWFIQWLVVVLSMDGMILSWLITFQLFRWNCTKDIILFCCQIVSERMWELLAKRTNAPRLVRDAVYLRSASDLRLVVKLSSLGMATRDIPQPQTLTICGSLFMTGAKRWSHRYKTQGAGERITLETSGRGPVYKGRNPESLVLVMLKLYSWNL